MICPYDDLGSCQGVDTSGMDMNCQECPRNKKIIKGSVALPIWNSTGIAWLCMESLCRQQKPSAGWELIVFEEIHCTMVGESFIRSYEDRLKEAGCERIVFLTDMEWIPLSHKWILMARAAAATSEYFCMCAADNYYSPTMLIEAEKAIKEGVWNVVTKGYFYDFLLDKVVLYEYFSIPLVGLQMVASTERVREFPLEVRQRGIDTWMSSHFGHKANIIQTDNWNKILCTNGFNNISGYRWEMIANEIPPFNHTEVKLEDIVPEDICSKIKELTKTLNEYIDNGSGGDNRA